MTSVLRGKLLPSALSFCASILRAHERPSEMLRSLLAASSSLAHARHTTPSSVELSNLRSLTAMAQMESTFVQQLDSQVQQLEQAQQHRKAQLETSPVLQQGFTIAPSSPQRPATGFKKTFYKRKLPSPPAIEFSSQGGRQLFQEALLDGYMAGFFKLMEQFNTQDEPAFCGLASLTMVLNALSIDPRRTWKGSWRWFHEAMLDCCRPLDVVKQEGITLFQASCLARCNGARVELRPYGSTTLEQFRSEVQAVCRSGEEHIIVSYSRKAFMQTGDGHFSPIGGYHREKDLVLVLDVARFKYPPHWVPLSMLYDAMSYIDPETGRPRGYMRLASNPLLDSVLLTLDLRSDAWRLADSFIRQGGPDLVQTLAAEGGLSAEEIVRRVVDAMPLSSLDAFLIVRSGAPPATSAAAPTSAGGTSEAATVPCAAPDALAAAADSAAEAATTASLAQSQSQWQSHAGDAAAVASTATAATRAHAAPGTKPCGEGASGAAKKTGSSSCGICSTSVDGGGGGGCSKSSLLAAAAAAFTAHDRCIPLAQRQQLLDELHGMPLFTLISNHLAAARLPSAGAAGAASLPAAGAAGGPEAAPSLLRSAPPGGEYLSEKVAMALLMQRPQSWPAEGRWRDPEAGRQWRALLGLGGYSVVEAEAAYLREQLQHIDEVLLSGDMGTTCGEHSSKLDCAAHGH